MGFFHRRPEFKVTCHRCSRVCFSRTDPASYLRSLSEPPESSPILRGTWSDGWVDPEPFLVNGGLIRSLCGSCERAGWTISPSGMLVLPGRPEITVKPIEP